MDKPVPKRAGLIIPRSRIPSNSSTPSSVIPRRGTSTPTGSSSKNRSCNFSPITNLDFSKSSAGSTDKLEPKLLKPLGPSFPAQQTLAEKKLAQSRTKLSTEEQATLMYMMYQQQHFLNNQIEESKDRVLAECKKQMEDLWNLVKIKENKISQIKERKRLEEMRIQLTSQIEVLEPIVKQTTDALSTVTPKVKELADGLDIYRHQIRLVDINVFKKEETDELIKVFKNSTTLSDNIQVEKFDEFIKAASVISDLNGTTAMQIGIMEEYVCVI
ncbi:hypothetical protein DAPPUDRAFT_101266 [Daphnia pulex]|uniref:Uncharacterized protein n=1 Tax=Daphnia pulex TaxID=6669 RepID=E9GCV7_DAPPU|nr:hypothetical protein DAPPUDRAFT_101266 [Daphnia pulex]|eukprot:EFX82620.1 hypothetical protein DAPPUDRAFT_101266 [Daphnia pulex]